MWHKTAGEMCHIGYSISLELFQKNLHPPQGPQMAADSDLPRPWKKYISFSKTDGLTHKTWPEKKTMPSVWGTDFFWNSPQAANLSHIQIYHKILQSWY